MSTTDPIELTALRELALVVRAFAPTGYPSLYLGSAGESFATLLVCGAEVRTHQGDEKTGVFDVATITIEGVEISAHRREKAPAEEASK